jgi:hypothetical protein
VPPLPVATGGGPVPRVSARVRPQASGTRGSVWEPAPRPGVLTGGSTGPRPGAGLRSYYSAPTRRSLSPITLSAVGRGERFPDPGGPYPGPPRPHPAPTSVPGVYFHAISEEASGAVRGVVLPGGGRGSGPRIVCARSGPWGPRAGPAVVRSPSIRWRHRRGEAGRGSHGHEQPRDRPPGGSTGARNSAHRFLNRVRRFDSSRGHFPVSCFV